ncbi:putative mitochondrial protein [Glycine soja]
MYINIEQKKIAWVSWTQCCASRDAGGLGIKDFRILNNSLLIKWKWYMFHQPEQLWNRILISKYQGWRGLDQGPHKQHFSTWWANLKALNQDHNMTTVSKQFCWKMGRGDQILFWEDAWAEDGIPLKDQFPDLYSISSQRNHIVADMGSFAWRLLWDRLPTKDNLAKRQILINNDLCPFCHSKPESAPHLFFTCEKIQPLWWEFLSWVKEHRTIHCKPMDNFVQHAPTVGTQAVGRRWKIWWLAATNSIWKVRNDIIFQNQSFDISKLADTTLFLMWTWLKGWEKDFTVSFTQWSSTMSLVFI